MPSRCRRLPRRKDVKEMRIPDYVIVGHLSLDQTDSGTSIGGTAAFAARAARLLGHRVGVVTAAPKAPEDFPELFGIEFVTVSSNEWTSFENKYHENGREQRWISTAAPILVDDLPSKWSIAPIVHLAPIAQEMPPDFALGCPSDQCCATIQGWLRGRSSSSKVLVELNPDLHVALRYLEVAIVGEDDVLRDDTLVNELAKAAGILVVTRAADGCDVFVEGVRNRITTTRLQIEDSTGAGDVFAAAFFSSFSANQDPLASGRFANEFAAWEGAAGATLG